MVAEVARRLLSHPRGWKKKWGWSQGCLMKAPQTLPPEEEDGQRCSWTSYSELEMGVHSTSHTETKPYKRPHCSRTFANSSHLVQHIHIHARAKPDSCNFCEKLLPITAFENWGLGAQGRDLL